MITVENTHTGETEAVTDRSAAVAYIEAETRAASSQELCFQLTADVDSPEERAWAQLRLATGNRGASWLPTIANGTRNARDCGYADNVEEAMSNADAIAAATAREAAAQRERDHGRDWG